MKPRHAVRGLQNFSRILQDLRVSARPRPIRPNFEVIAPDVYVVLSMSCVEFFKMTS